MELVALRPLRYYRQVNAYSDHLAGQPQDVPRGGVVGTYVGPDRSAGGPVKFYLVEVRQGVRRRVPQDLVEFKF